MKKTTILLLFICSLLLILTGCSKEDISGTWEGKPSNASLESEYGEILDAVYTINITENNAKATYSIDYIQPGLFASSEENESGTLFMANVDMAKKTFTITDLSGPDYDEADLEGLTLKYEVKDNQLILYEDGDDASFENADVIYHRIGE